jgi:RNA polymerase sigma factor (sigma-70 family)
MPVKLKIGKSVSSAPRRDAGPPVLHQDPACCLAAINDLEPAGAPRKITSAVIRRILVDYARRRSAAKRGAGIETVALTHEVAASPTQSVDTLALDDALTRLPQRDQQQARIVEMRFFGGLTNDEIGAVLGVSSRTVTRDWNMARAWLYDELSS